MEPYRVEKVRVRVALKTRDGLEIRGGLFVPVEPDDQPFVVKIQQLLNDPDPFLPVDIGGAEPVLQNKARLLWCRYDGPPGPVVEVMLPRRRVTLVLDDGTSVSGDLVAQGPPDRRRVLDCLNLAPTFFLVESGDGEFLLRKEAVSLVPSGEDGDPRPESDPFEVEADVGAATF